MAKEALNIPVERIAAAKPGYKKTKLGWIPKDWEVKKLGRLGRFYKGKGILKADLTPDGLPCVTYGELYTRHHIVIEHFHSFIPESVAAQSFLIHQNDILFAGSGETAEEIGKCAAFVGMEEAYAGGDVILFRQNEIDALFLSLALNSQALVHQRARLGQGYSVVHIYPHLLAELDIPLPPLPEQRRIAAILGTWDRAIATVQQLLAAQQKRKRGLMQELLSGKRRLNGQRPITDSKIPSEGWGRVELSEFVRRSSAKYDPKGNETALPIIELEHIEPGTGTMLGVTDSAETVSMKNRFTAGQVLFGKLRPYLRKFMRPAFDGACSSEIWVLDGVPKKCDNSFLYYLVQGEYFVAACNKTSGSKMPRADWDLVAETPFLLPPIEEQKAIGTVLRLLERECQTLQDQLTHLTAQKRGLMQQLLTGRVRVKVD